ncbi:MAG: hypothetical protein RLZZ272_893, partial [Actinomycetota bacterium]
MVALAVAELAAARVRSVPSPTAAVADLVVALVPGRLVTTILGLLRGAARPLTLVAVVAAVAGIGALIGRLHGAADRPPGRAGAARAARALLVAVTVAAGAAAQLAQRGTSMPPTLVIACGALLVAVAVLELPARRAGVPRSEPLAAPPAPGTGVVPTAEPAIVPPGGPDPGHASGSPGAPLVGRRQVLLAGIGLALVATGALVGRATDRVRALVRLPAVARPLPAVTAAQDLAPAVEGLSPVLTPVADFYRIDTALTVPQVDVASWRLRITG